MDIQRTAVSGREQFTQSRNKGSGTFFGKEEDSEFLSGRLKVYISGQADLSVGFRAVQMET